MHTSIYVGKYVENYLSIYVLVYAVTHCIVQLTYIQHWGQNPMKMHLNAIIKFHLKIFFGYLIRN